ncbi:hypothetical protein NV64_11640 [Erwinia sp. B116]|nr:hypothetical protein ASF13_01100 [Erwinia sp. Leaf53]PLV60836.1 hypothetical protein NV64_11640 [Erwinia sp. B116]
MKWPIALVSLLLITVLLLAAGLIHRPSDKGGALLFDTFTGEDLQLGYYDLLASQREIYDTHFDRRDNSLVLTLTSPNDNRFMAKVSLEQPQADGEGVTWRYRPIHYADSGNARMIKNILGNAEQNGVRFDAVHFGKDLLAITPSGQILLVN